MRRLRHLAPLLVLLSALLAASQLTSATIVKEDAFIDQVVNLKELKNYSSLVENDNDLSLDGSSPEVAQIIRGNPFHSNPSSSPCKLAFEHFYFFNCF